MPLLLQVIKIRVKHNDNNNENILIYLNDIPKENGGSLTIFKNKYTKKTKRVFN